MSEPPEPQHLPKMKKKKEEKKPDETLPTVPPQMLTARALMEPEELKEIIQNLPSLTKAFQIPDMDRKTMPDVLQVVVGTQYGKPDIYSILERTRLTDEENNIFCDLIKIAEHGIGVEGLDFTIPLIGEFAVNRLRGKVSIGGESRKEFERMTTAWIRYLYAQEQDQKDKHQAKMSGAGS